ncbi:MAG: hypothetical protein QOJ88_303 [Pyrinomonadaceae bacterium]|jgi:uncharacterized membrane protein YphA (DoxX/SURF4 family)/thiol-disulfide isomerase/thioredoxin|nr:hypothetical protein [Pyrinomonadaceae bacterium]
MHLIIVLLRLALSTIFSIAGVTKLLDPRGTRDAVKNFGVPGWLAPAVSILLPLTELAIALGLLFDQAAGASAIAALAVLGLFVAAISVSLARGRTHDCHCFGQLYSRPLGWPTLVRNAVFALAAAVVWWQLQEGTGENILGTLGQLRWWQWLMLLTVSAAIVAGLVFSYRRQKQQALTAAAPPLGLPLNSVAPAFELAAYAGGTSSLPRLLAPGKPLLLIFTNPTCGPCVVLFKEIKEWQEAHSEQLTIALISFGTIKENFVNVARNGLGQVLLQQKREVAEKYRAHVTPTAVVVDTSGRIGSPLAAGADEIRALLGTVLGNSQNTNHHHDAA